MGKMYKYFIGYRGVEEGTRCSGGGVGPVRDVGT